MRLRAASCARFYHANDFHSVNLVRIIACFVPPVRVLLTKASEEYEHSSYDDLLRRHGQFNSMLVRNFQEGSGPLRECSESAGSQCGIEFLHEPAASSSRNTVDQCKNLTAPQKARGGEESRGAWA